MKNYEIMFIVKPTLSEEEIKKGNETYKSGYYYVIDLESNDDKAINEFNRLALISQDVIRHLITKIEK